MNKWMKTYWKFRHQGNFDESVYEWVTNDDADHQKPPGMTEFDYAEKIGDYLAMIKIEPKSFRDINNPSEELQLTAIKFGTWYTWDIFQYIIDKGIKPSEQVQLAAAKKNGYVITFIENPSEEVQLAAVRSTPESIKYIENPTEEVIDAARDRGYDKNGNYITDRKWKLF